MEIMKTIKTVLPFVITLLMVVIACDKKQSTEPELGSANSTDYGRPKKITIPYSDWFLTGFGIITDTHVDASNAALLPSKDFPYDFGYWYRDTDRVRCNRHVIYHLNRLMRLSDGLGIVHLGDMVSDNNVQNLVAFRQLWEHDYYGYDGGAIAGVADDHYDAYSQGSRINYLVLPSLGNHDSPYFGDDPTDWRYAAAYINDRVIGAGGLLSQYNTTAYAWRWGDFFFIHLGMWAGSFEHESNTEIDQAKIEWLQNFLITHVGDSNLGVFVFQHYGWDSFSTQDRWWNAAMRRLELEILLPYNVLGIFTGHAHKRLNIKVLAGTDEYGNNVYFDNFVMDDACGDGAYGCAYVFTDGNRMWVSSYNCVNDIVTDYEKDIHVGP